MSILQLCEKDFLENYYRDQQIASAVYKDCGYIPFLYLCLELLPDVFNGANP